MKAAKTAQVAVQARREVLTVVTVQVARVAGVASSVLCQDESSGFTSVLLGVRKLGRHLV